MTPQLTHAAPHSVCLHFDLDAVYVDASPVGEMCDFLQCQAMDPACCDQREDFGRRDEEHRWAVPRLLSRVRGDGAVLWGWRPLNDLGCTGTFDTDLSTVSVDYVPWSHWSERNTSIVGFNCDNTQEPSRCAFEPSSVEDLPLDGSGTTRLVITDPDGPGPLHALDSILWAAAFAETRVPLWSDTVSYLVSTNVGKTIANTLIGGQPTANYNQTHIYKFIITHEYGHVQTLLQPILLLGEIFDGSDVDYTFMTPDVGQHTLTSPEWQAAATLEGFAHYYSLLVWWDPATPVAKLLGPAMTPDLVARRADTEFHRRIDAACLQFDLDACPPGVATETDWMAALWNFSLATTPPEDVLRLLGLAFPWPVNGADDAYWLHFKDAIAGVLSPGEFDAFVAIAAEAGIDR